jgi:hypothetical protein
VEKPIPSEKPENGHWVSGLPIVIQGANLREIENGMKTEKS